MFNELCSKCKRGSKTHCLSMQLITSGRDYAASTATPSKQMRMMNVNTHLLYFRLLDVTHDNNVKPGLHIVVSDGDVSPSVIGNAAETLTDRLMLYFNLSIASTDFNLVAVHSVLSQMCREGK